MDPGYRLLKCLHRTPPISAEQQGAPGVVSLAVMFCKQEGRCYRLDADSSSKVLVLKPCSWWHIIGRGGGLSVEAPGGIPRRNLQDSDLFTLVLLPGPVGRDLTLPCAALPPPET